jgi:hypothetical protein
VKCTTGPKDQQCTDLSPLSLWLALRSLDEGGLALRSLDEGGLALRSLDEGGLALRSLDEGGTGGDTRPTETRTAARIFNIQFSIFNRKWNENVKENVKFQTSSAPGVVPPSDYAGRKLLREHCREHLRNRDSSRPKFTMQLSEVVHEQSSRRRWGSFRLANATPGWGRSPRSFDLAPWRQQDSYRVRPGYPEAVSSGPVSRPKRARQWTPGS